jgi:hypothetical protein
MPRRPITLLIAAGTLVLSSAAIGGDGQERRHSDPCPRASLGSGYVSRVTRALRATEDVWGNELLEAPGGPTYAGARTYLQPLLLARAAHGARLTTSGVHYIPFSGPVGVQGAGSMALHVADGSQILAQRASGRSLTVTVGDGGRERYGSCLARLVTPRLADGYLPILVTDYVDAGGVRYRQESFATRIGETRSLVSFVELSVDAEASNRRATRLRFTLSEPGLVAKGDTLVRGGETYLAFGPGASVKQSTVTYEVPAGSFRTVYVAVLNSPAAARPLQLDRAAYESARRGLVLDWERRLTEGATIEVPERRVHDAYRSLLVQELALTWRYSIGNPYQEFSFPEGVDVAQVMSAHGYSDVARAMLLESFTTPLTRYPNWKMGQKLVGSALHFRLYRDRSYIERVTPFLRAYMAELGDQIRANPSGILSRERFSSDIKDSVYGLHSQAVVWQGLRSMASVWAVTGHRSLATEARSLAARLEAGLRSAVRVSQRRLPDGSLFVPARLLDREEPYKSVTQSRSGGYWNLVAPYAFASGLFAPGSPEANGVIRYMLQHGSRLLGLVRAGAYSLYGLDPVYPTSGVNPVYGLNVARLLADNDRPDQLVLSLYGQLAAGMASGTFVSGEGLSVAPLQTDDYRSMYLPPNGASNASFLETLRLMLVHETRGLDLEPRGLELAYATPRAWLSPGKRIAVRSAPTSFGLVSFAISSREDELGISLDVPGRSAMRTLRLRLRLPEGRGIGGVTLDGHPYRRFDARAETIDLSGRTGRLSLVVRVDKR